MKIDDEILIAFDIFNVSVEFLWNKTAFNGETQSADAVFRDYIDIDNDIEGFFADF